jgi:hypothetical protein
MPGEEIPRIVAVNHSTELWYVTWDGASWTSVNLNTAIANPFRSSSALAPNGSNAAYTFHLSN